MNRVDGVLVEHLQCGCHGKCRGHKQVAPEKTDHFYPYVLGFLLGVLVALLILEGV